jgi:hypothetical protein
MELKGPTEKDLEGQFEEQFTGKLRWKKRPIEDGNAFMFILQQEVKTDFFNNAGELIETNYYWLDVPWAKE